MIADPVIGNPADSQMLNPYAYLGNNPLSGTDPSGYEKECDKDGKNCSLTNVVSLTAIRQHDGRYIGIATDDQGNQIRAEAITNGIVTSDGVGVTATPLTQKMLAGIVNRDSSSIMALQQLGFGGRSVAAGSGFDQGAFDIHERNSHLAEIGWGMGREMVKTAAALVACEFAPEICVAYGAMSTAEEVRQGNYAGAAVDGLLTVIPAAGTVRSFRNVRTATTVGEATAAKTAPSFFEGATYTPKVLQQASRGAGEFHSFPAAVDAFESAGTVRSITGGDKVVRQVLEIPGSYATLSSPGVPGRLYDGVFQYIKNPDGTINHRLFVPNP